MRTEALRTQETSGHRLTIYKASAGSGKTYTLTQEYLRLLLRPGIQPGNILAITFTNAAANDMKRKILETLAQLSQGQYPDWPKLLSPGQQPPSRPTMPEPEQACLLHARLQEQAREKLRLLLHRYQDFSVKTIDSFVQNLIKPFAFELGLPRNYTPEVELKKLSEEITGRLIDEFGQTGKETQTEILKMFLLKQEQEGKSLNPEKKIQETVGLLFNEGSLEALESLKGLHSRDFLQIIPEIEDCCRGIEAQAETLIEQGKNITARAGLKSEDFHGGKKGLFAWFNPEAEIRIDLQKLTNPSDSLQKHVRNGILKNPDRASEAEALLQCFNAITQLRYDRYLLLKEVSKHVYTLALTSHAYEILENIEQATGIVPLPEFNQRIDKALNDENNDFIYERTGTRYRHIFIDEFQDTSRLQWKNLRPLIENNLAQGLPCLLVGDPKQSIYRFRSADLEQFVALCQVQGGIEADVRDLQSNWRSDEGIIAFNNLFYDFLLQEGSFEKYFPQSSTARADALARKIFQGHRQFCKGQTNRYPDPKPEAVRIYIARNLEKEALQEWRLRNTWEIIRQHEPGQVAVLCPKNQQGREIADYLVSRGVPVSTSDSLKLGTHNGLHLLVFSLRYMDRKEIFFKAATFHLAKQLGLWPGQPGRSPSKESLPEDLFSEWKSDETARHFRKLESLKNQQADVYDTAEAVIRFWNMNTKADQFLLAFLDQVQEHRFPRLSDLTDWWDESGKSLSLPTSAEGQAVQIMSIHKAKGLEFPVVILPFASSADRKNDNLYWLRPGLLPEKTGLPTALIRHLKEMKQTEAGADILQEEQLQEIDSLNLLYVATTRPRQKLYLFAADTKETSGFHANEAISDFIRAYPLYLEKEEDGSRLPAEEGESRKDLPAPGPEERGTFQTGTPENAASFSCQETFSPETVPVGPACSFSSHDWRSLAQATAPLPEIPSEEQEWGNFIHKTLSCIKNRTEESIEEALRGTLNQYASFGQRAEEARSTLREILSHPLLAPCFEAGCRVKTEAPIALPNEQTCIPDRIVFKENATLVLDFKTGEPHARHARQVRAYMDCLQRMGYPGCKGYLVYTGKPCTVEIVEAEASA